jgi:hypothetical protein
MPPKNLSLPAIDFVKKNENHTFRFSSLIHSGKNESEFAWRQGGYQDLPEPDQPGSDGVRAGFRSP